MSEIRTVRLSAIKPNVEQPRKYFDELLLNELAVSIKATGLLNPIMVQPQRGGTFLIVDGERRYHACKLAGLDEVDVLVKPLLDNEVYKQAVVANFQRADMTPLEISMALKKLLDAGASIRDAAAMIGKSENYVRNMLKLSNLAPRLRVMLERCEVSPGVAKLVASYAPTEQHTLARKVTEKLKALGRYDARDLSRVVKQQAEALGLEKQTKKDKRRNATATELLVRDVARKAAAFVRAAEQLLEVDEAEVLTTPGETLLDFAIIGPKAARTLQRLTELAGKA